MEGARRAEPVAIVGIGCRFPGGADSPAAYWSLLARGVSAITELPRDRFDLAAFFDPNPEAPGKIYSKWGGFVGRLDELDADFFGIAPREARHLDPQHRLILEVVWEALQDGGQVIERIAGSRTGVFVGISSHDHADVSSSPSRRQLLDTHSVTAAAAFSAANRVSRLLDVHGPSLAVDTACSSSLTALHLARQSLRNGDCEMAIVAGANAILTPEAFISLCKARVLSPDGRCRAFGAHANGYVRGEGAGAIILKPLDRALADGDPIHAVLRATAANQDGRTPALGIPSAESQEAMFRDALREADLAAHDIQYVEAHGTGTAAGDPIEAKAIGHVYGIGRPADQPCLLGSVKTNIGHLEAGAGIAGIIKAALALEHRQIPASLNCSEPNPGIAFDEWRLRVPTSLEQWPNAETARAAVSSFGIGGANAHAILEQAPARDAVCSRDHSAHVLAISARSIPALKTHASDYAERLREGAASLHDVCYTAAMRRDHFEQRLAVAGTSAIQVAESLDAFVRGEDRVGIASARCRRDAAPRIAFVFSGMGPQAAQMGLGLAAEEPVFRDALAECDAILLPIAGWSLLEELARAETESRVASADVAHVANLCVQVALVQLWRSWGIEPSVVVGHSSAEMAAAWAAGAIDLADAIFMAFHRGQLQHRLTGTGRMLAAGIDAERAAKFVADHEGAISIAAINSRTSVTLAGSSETLEQIARELERDGQFCRLLPVEIPYHSPGMESIRDELFARYASLTPRETATPMISTATGRRVDGTALVASHWWRTVRDPVRFADAMDVLLDDGCEIFVEVGPHPVLAASISECIKARGRAGLVLPSLRRASGERESMLRSLGALHTRGCHVRWRAVYPSGTHSSLPTYPWQRERHWLDLAPAPDDAYRRSADSMHPLLGARLRAPRAVWESEISDPRLSYLEGHRVGDATVFPGAAYVEMALAVARELAPDGRPYIRDVEFRRMLALPRLEGTTLQVLHNASDGSLEIHAASDQQADWTLHASCVIASTAPTVRRQSSAIDLASIRERCVESVSSDDFYRALAARNLHYSGLFRGVRDLWRGDAEALGRISVAPADVEHYVAHPALLDAAFQVLAGALPARNSDARSTILPVSIRSVSVVGQIGGECWAYASIRAAAKGEIEGDLCMVDDAGNVLLSCEGMRFRAVAAPGRESTAPDELLYELTWDEVSLDHDAVFDSHAIGASVSSRVPIVCEPLRASGYYDKGEALLNRIAEEFAGEALRELGYDRSRDDHSGPEQLAAQLRIDPRHRHLFERILQLGIGARGQSPTALGAAALATLPGCVAETKLLMHCGRALAGVVRGDIDARELLFGEDRELVSAVYHESPIIRVYNELAAELVGASVAAVTNERPLRILEIGAGTGALTSSILRRLASHQFEYRFTDVSAFFFARGSERFGDVEGLTFGVLDIESDPAEQAIEPHSFDIVIASDVLHATRDLRQTLKNTQRLLRPGGLLVFVEFTRDVAWADLVFGMLEGWWRFSDHDLRPSSALAAADVWRGVLEEEGFENVTVIRDSPLPQDSVQSVFVARAHRRTAPAQQREWLLLADDTGVAESLCLALRAKGDACIVITPSQAVDVSAMVTADHCPDSIVFLRAIDAPESHATTDELMAFEDAMCSGLLDLVRALERAQRTPDVWIVTAGAQSVDPVADPPDPAQAPLIGLGRVLMNEQPAIRTRLVDLGASAPRDEIDALLREFAADDVENELALRGNRRFARRIRRFDSPSGAPVPARVDINPDVGTFVVDQRTRGALASIELRESIAPVPGRGEIAMRVLAAGLNFRDVLKALAMPPFSGTHADADASPQQECTGIVVACGEGVDRFRVGDEVIALPSTSLGSHARASEALAVRKPPALSFEDAATVLVGFVTAHYALNHLARMTPGERVLIHSATGAVGLAAIQLCRRAGAEIFATAGSPEKREYLRSLGIEHVFDSRSLDFADEVLARTNGEGVDVVLNSLAGEAITRGLEILRTRGRFVEIGKRDIYSGSKLGLLPFRKSIAFFGLDMAAPGVIEPQMLDLIAGQLADGSLVPLPRTVFDVAEAEQAYRLMAQAKHIGKVVLSLGRSRYSVVGRDRLAFHADASYLITGGLGGFGIAVARWMVDLGARHIVLVSRTGAPRAEDAEALAALEARAHIVRCSADVARESDLARVFAEVRDTVPPLRGVVHAAMVLDDAMLTQIDASRLERVLAPKIAGAWNLHRQTLDQRLDFFVLFSSIASVIGHPLQGNYAAANAFLDAFSAFRRSRGLPSVTVSWGALGEIGYVAQHDVIRDYIARLGLELMAPREALDCLERALTSDCSHVVATRSDWRLLGNWNRMVDASRSKLERARTDESTASSVDTSEATIIDRLRAAEPPVRIALLQSHVLEKVARILGTTAAKLDAERGLTDMGLDSLMAVELTTGIKLELGAQLGVASVLQGLSSRAVAAAILEQLDLGDDRPSQPVASTASEPPVVAETVPLSFEQRQFWFLDRLSPGTPAFNLTANARLSGVIDVRAFGRAIDEVVRRHDVLRARFTVVDDEPAQVIRPFERVAVPLVDLTALTVTDRDAEVRRLATEEAQRSFDLLHDSLIRVTLLRLAEGEHVVLLTAHHIVCDAWSVNVLVREIAAFYDVIRAGRRESSSEPASRYTDYVRRQRERLSADILRKQLGYWRGKLADLPAALQLPSDRSRTAGPTSRGGHRSFEVSSELSTKLAELSKREGVTLFTTLLAAFQTFLHRYTGAHDIVVGSPVLSRNDVGARDVVGCCMNTVALRTDLAGDPTFRELLGRTRDTALGALTNVDVPFDRVVSEIAPPRQPGRGPLFDVMFVLHNFRMPPLSLAGLTLEPLELESGTASCDLMLVIDSADTLRGTLEYSVDLFDAATAALMVGHFITLLDSIVATPEAPISGLSLQSPAERQCIAEYNMTGIDFGGPDPARGARERTNRANARRTRDSLRRSIVDVSRARRADRAGRAQTARTRRTEGRPRRRVRRAFNRTRRRCVGRSDDGCGLCTARRGAADRSSDDATRRSEAVPRHRASLIENAAWRLSMAGAHDGRRRRHPGTCDERTGRRVVGRRRIHHLHVRIDRTSEGCDRRARGDLQSDKMAQSHLRHFARRRGATAHSTCVRSVDLGAVRNARRRCAPRSPARWFRCGSRRGYPPHSRSRHHDTASCPGAARSDVGRSAPRAMHVTRARVLRR